MKRISLFILLNFLALHFACGQAGTWTWISGDSLKGAPGVSGTRGVPSVNYSPTSNYEMVEWKDRQGNLWLYGGTVSGSTYMWRFNPVTLEWTWVAGNGWDTTSYGTIGVASPSNTPGMASYGAVTWVDTSGLFWLFSGFQKTNDLWKFDAGTNEWTWVNGNHTMNGSHGTMGVPSSSNVPGARSENPSAWTDANNNLWLYGGLGYDESGTQGKLDDVMKYNISTNEWTWMKGSAYADAPAGYGVKRVSNATNDPGGRWNYTRWKDKQNNFWIMGGYGANDLNDVWKYNPASNEWTWMTGPNTIEDTGTYGSTCIYDNSYNPASRHEQRSVTDNCGRFWLFGGFNLSGYGFNDLWLFDPQLVQWKWLSGGSTTNQPGNYGSKGVPSAANMPASRLGACLWWGNDNKLYMFGGMNNAVFPFETNDLWVFNPDTNCVSVCSNVTAFPPVAGFSASQTSLCQYDCVNYTDKSTNATSWLWSFAGGTPAASTDQNPQVCYLGSGIYNAMLIASNSGGSDTLSINNYVTVHAAPLTPTITQAHNDTLFCSTNAGYISYQWYADSNKLAGKTDTFLVISKGGNYNVEVTNANGCKISVGINVILGLQNFMNDHFVSLSPNPTRDKFTVYGLWFTVRRVDIYNVLGEITESTQFATGSMKPETILDVLSLTSGIYFVQLIGEKERWTGRFVKE